MNFFTFLKRIGHLFVGLKEMLFTVPHDAVNGLGLFIFWMCLIFLVYFLVVFFVGKKWGYVLTFGVILINFIFMWKAHEFSHNPMPIGSGDGMVVRVPYLEIIPIRLIILLLMQFSAGVLVRFINKNKTNKGEEVLK